MGARRQGFRSLKLATVAMDEPLAEKPVGVDFGVLDNGLTYYVRCNPKPRMRAALALAVKVRVSSEDLEKERGAVLEEYRGGRNAAGRMQDAHWVLMFQGSKSNLPLALDRGPMGSSLSSTVK
ncbi:hypothetical protein GW17_00022039 [Ensete ventricosum]|nr:hypothetical protein GW17_00022039 [Ensete ventricosum]